MNNKHTSRNLAVCIVLLYHHEEFELSWPLKRTLARSRNIGLNFNEQYWVLESFSQEYLNYHCEVKSVVRTCMCYIVCLCV